MIKTHFKWLAVAVAVAVAGLIIFALWRAGVTCSSPRHRSALKIGEAAGCYEFWLNRYQAAWSAALGVIATLSAAAAAWLAVQRQIGQTNRQARLSQWQAAIATRTAMDKDRHTVRRAYSAQATVSKHMSAIKCDDTLIHRLNTMDPLLQICEDLLDQIESTGSPWSEEATDVRNRINYALREIILTNFKIKGDIIDKSASDSPGATPDQPLLNELDMQMQGVAKIKTEYLRVTAAEIVPMGKLCERLRKLVFAE